MAKKHGSYGQRDLDDALKREPVSEASYDKSSEKEEVKSEPYLAPRHEVISTSKVTKRDFMKLIQDKDRLSREAKSNYRTISSRETKGVEDAGTREPVSETGYSYSSKKEVKSDPSLPQGPYKQIFGAPPAPLSKKSQSEYREILRDLDRAIKITQSNTIETSSREPRSVDDARAHGFRPETGYSYSSRAQFNSGPFLYRGGPRPEEFFTCDCGR